MVKNTKVNSVSVAVLVLAIVVGAAGIQISRAYATTVRNLATQAVSERIRVTSADIAGATSVDGDGSKKLKIFTIPAGGQLLSFVTKVTTGFSVPSGTNITMSHISAEQNGVEVSTGDLGQTTLLNVPVFANGIGTNPEYGIFSEDLPTDVYIYVDTSDRSSLNALTQGSMDILVSGLK